MGLVVNAVLGYAWIFGRWGFPEAGIAGAGWATVVASWASALLGLVLMFRSRYREEYGTLTGWKPDRPLLGRMLWFGLPSGLQVTLDVLAFAVFTFLVGRMGEAQLAASGMAFTLNIVGFVPMLGIGQAVGVLVGQRLGEDRPDLAERSAWTGFKLTWVYMAALAALYLGLPGPLVELFRSREAAEAARWAEVAPLVPVLLRFVAIYSLFDGINLVFSFALKGAGDTRFVTGVMLVMAWPVMVLPTWAAQVYGWGLFAAWTFASLYIIGLAFIFLARFRAGFWKSMRVIEAVPQKEEAA